MPTTPCPSAPAPISIAASIRARRSRETLATLRRVVFDANVRITVVPPIRPLAKAPPLDPKIMGPAEKLVAKYFPGVPLVPKMFAATTDGGFRSARTGIPVYGVPGGWLDPDNNGTHGLNERRSIRSVSMSGAIF